MARRAVCSSGVLLAIALSLVLGAIAFSLLAGLSVEALVTCFFVNRLTFFDVGRLLGLLGLLGSFPLQLRLEFGDVR